MRESIKSEEKSIRLDDEGSSLGDSMYIPNQTQTVRNDEEKDNSINEEREREINLDNNSNSNSIKINNNKDNSNDELKKKNSNYFQIIDNEENEKEKEKGKNISKNREKRGNIINSLILEKKKNLKIYIKIDKEKTIKEKYTVYELSTLTENKKLLNQIEKNILCFRRYSNFQSFYELLKVRYPHFIFPRLSPKMYINKVIDINKVIGIDKAIGIDKVIGIDKTNVIDEERRRLQLEYFINEIFNHSCIGKGEELKKFLYETKFDNQYFQNLINFFDYPECTKKLNENGLINYGVNVVANTFNYLIGKKSSDNENYKSKIIFGKKEKIEKQIQKYKLTFEEMRNIYESLKEENNEKKDIQKNLLFLKDKANNNNMEKNLDIKQFNELTDINQDYNTDKNIEYFQTDIINPLDFCLLDLMGEKKAIKRYSFFLQNYNNIINYKKQDKDNNVILEEQTKIKNDIEIYEETLINEIDRVEENVTKIYNDIINRLCIYFINSTKKQIDNYNKIYIEK